MQAFCDQSIVNVSMHVFLALSLLMVIVSGHILILY